MPDQANHVVLVHGYAGSTERQWFPWLHAKVEERGLRVTAFAMPQPLKPNFATWMRHGEKIAESLTPRSVVVAHSLGAIFLMRLLAKHSKVKVRAIILVSPLYAAMVSVKPLTAFFNIRFDWAQLRRQAEAFEVIHAENDPLVPFDHGLRYADSLDAKMHLLPRGGHLNGRTLPELLKVVEKYI